MNRRTAGNDATRSVVSAEAAGTGSCSDRIGEDDRLGGHPSLVPEPLRDPGGKVAARARAADRPGSPGSEGTIGAGRPGVGGVHVVVRHREVHAALAEPVVDRHDSDAAPRQLAADDVGLGHVQVAPRNAPPCAHTRPRAPDAPVGR